MDNEEILNEGIQVAATQIPPTPTNVTTTNQTQTTATITWDEALEAAGYRVFRGTSATGPFTQVAEVSNTSYVDQNLTPNTTYYYTVLAYNELGESAQTAALEVTTLALIPPTNLVVTPVSNNGLLLTWTPPADYDNFTIYRSETIDGTFAQIATTDQLTYLDDGLEANTTYYYRVFTNLNGETSATFVVGTGTTTDTPTPPVDPTLTPPTRVVAIKVSCSTMELRWNLVNGATSYNVYRSTTLDGDYALINTSYGFNYFDTDLTNGTRYFYYVTSVNAEGESDRSIITTNTTYANCNNTCFDRRCRIVNNNGYIYKCCCYQRRRCTCCNED